MPSEMMMLRQMLSGDQLPLVVLAALFVALLFRRESIVSFRLFRLGYIFFILSLVLPVLLQSFLAAVGPPGGLRSGFPADGYLLAIYNSLGPLFSAIGLLCILGSLMPPRTKRSRVVSPAPPQKHPLDE
jgi:hypothetical protein